jgi:hypothetical protein
VGSYHLDGPSPGPGGDKFADDLFRAVAEAREHVICESMSESTVLPRPWHSECAVVSTWIDTPLERCVSNIYQRRTERSRNVGRPLDQKKLTSNWRRAQDLANRFGFVRLTFGDDLYEQVHDLLVSGGWTCDRHPLRWSFDWEARVRHRIHDDKPRTFPGVDLNRVPPH